MTPPVPANRLDAARGCGFGLLGSIALWTLAVFAVLRWCI
jgi:hypothetical protein